MDSPGVSRLCDESRELARQDGRTEARASDRALARIAATGPGDFPAQEIPSGAEDLIIWDVSPDDAGHLTDEIDADDEADIAAEMAATGRDDADRDLRRAGHANTP